jgi:uncharacterized protein
MRSSHGLRPRRGSTTAALAALAVLAAGCSADDPAGSDAGSDTASDTGSEGPTSRASVSGRPSSKPTAEAATRSGEPDLARLGQRELDRRLIAAAWDGDVRLARRLIEQGADVNAKDGTGQNAYLIATSEGHDELLELTLRNGAEPLARDRYDGTGVIRAAERGHADVVGRLVREGVPVDHVNNLGWTALHEAIVLGNGSQRHLRTVRVLVAAGADVRIRSRRDDTPPPEQARSRGYDAMADLLAAAARADSGGAPRNPDRRLLAAARTGDVDQVALALRYGGRTGVRDAQGRTPQQLATRGGHSEAARLLRAMGG